MINLKEYQQVIERVIQFSQSYPFDLNCEDIVNKWYENKKHFIDLFGGTPCVCTDQVVDFYLSEEDRESYFREFLIKICEKSWGHYSYEGVTLKEYFSMNRKGFFENTVVANVGDLSKNNRAIKIGDRLLRSLRNFFDKQSELRMCQDLASEYIQKNKIKGYVYFSVDPVDFLLASENNENWRSCHALDGEYRAGNLSYLVDKTTVMVYIASDKRENLRMLPKDLTDYSKKVRLYIHLNDTIMYYGKMYPFDLPNLREYIRQAINEFYVKGYTQEQNSHFTINRFMPSEQIGFNMIQMPNEERHVLNENWFCCWGDIVRSSEVINRATNALNYYDLIHSTSYRPYASFEKTNYYTLSSIKDLFQIDIGENVPCSCGCGNVITDERKFVCQDCAIQHEMQGDYFDHCSDCGLRLFDEDEYYVENDALYCSRCYDPYDSYDYDYDDDYDYFD